MSKQDRVAMLKEQAQKRKITKSLEQGIHEAGSDSEEEKSDEEDFFKIKTQERDLDADHSKRMTAMAKPSKSAMKTITTDGPYQGRNVLKFDDPSNSNVKENKKNSAYLDSIRDTEVNIV